MPKIVCPECDRRIAMHELEAKTVTQSSGFDTHYRCPYCHSGFEDVKQHLV